MSVRDIALAAAFRTFSTDVPIGQAVITTLGSSTWTVPAGVTSISMVAVQSGGHLTTSGTYATLVRGSVGGPNVLQALNGAHIGTAGFNGGVGYHGGGGAGGYSGAGGRGALIDNYNQQNALAGAGGGGGGGSAGGAGATYRGGGGGVGLLGEGASGASGVYNQDVSVSDTFGRGGSGGANGVAGGPYLPNPTGGLYGGGGGWANLGYSSQNHRGGGLAYLNNYAVTPGQVLEIYIGTPSIWCGQGAVRIIWGAGREFPSTLTGDL